MNQVGNQEQPSSFVGKARLYMRLHLKQRVENEKLNSGPAEYFITRHAFEHFFHRVLSPIVAIADGILAEHSLSIDQCVICTPTVYADAANRPFQLASAFGCFPQSGLDVFPDSRNIPTQSAVAPIAISGLILEAMHFLQQ